MLIRLKNQKAGGEKHFSNSFRIYLLSFLFYLCSVTSFAQCAMCRAAIESEGNSVKAEAINDGIVYLMVIPYLLVAAIGYAVYRMFSKKKE